MEDKIVAYLQGELAEAECEKVREWRSATDENASTFLEVKIAWLASMNSSSSKLMEARSKVLSRIGDISENPQETRSTSKFPWLAAAAVAILLIATFLLFQSDSGELNYTKIQLSDGSKIYLHGDAEILNDDYSEQNRIVEIDGKAFFEVKKMKDSPFIVLTKKAKIEVLGTSFSVNSQAQLVEVQVQEGVVEVTRNDIATPVAVKLEKGEEVMVAEGNRGIVKRNISNENAFSWKTGDITLKRRKLGEVASLLDEVYGVTVSFENQALKNCFLSAKFRSKNVKEVLEIIKRTFDIDYERKGKEIVLTGTGC
ncbi:MAG: FecR family protein [Bacteroidota bacterium]